MANNVIYHHGILGQRWGVRRYQNADGSLTKAGLRRQHALDKKDMRWAKKNTEKITSRARTKSAKELKSYQQQLLRDPNARTKSGKLSSSTIMSYNQKMASLMNEKVSGLKSPSGKTVSFVAKRGEIGVFMALADQGYNMQQLKNGIYGSGKVAYKKTVIDKVET